MVSKLAATADCDSCVIRAPSGSLGHKSDSGPGKRGAAGCAIDNAQGRGHTTRVHDAINTGKCLGTYYDAGNGRAVGVDAGTQRSTVRPGDLSICRTFRHSMA